VNGEQLVRKRNPTRACEDCKRIRLATTAKDAAGRFAQRKSIDSPQLTAPLSQPIDTERQTRLRQRVSAAYEVG
jgi:hypothetical protein